MLSRKIKIFLPVLALWIGAFVFISQGKVFAGTVGSTFPRDNNWVLLSKYSCSGHCLHTPNASFRIFYDTTTSEYNNNNTFSVSVDVICRGGTSHPGSGMQFGNNGVKPWGNCGGRLSTSPDYTISQTVGKGALRTDGGGHGYPARYAYTDLSTKLGDGDPADTIIAIIVRANNGGKVTFQEIPTGRNANPYGGNSNNYTGHGSGPRNGPYSELSSDGSGTAFALFQNTGGATYPRNFSAYFKTDCNLDTNQAVYLRWYDSDYGTSTQPFSLSFDLFDETDNKYVYNNYNGNLGGNDSYRQIKFVAEVGHQYRWTWNNVASINGVQLWLPYSEFNRDIDCGTPVSGNITTARCDTVIATGIKGENAAATGITKNLPVQLKLWNAGTGTYVRTVYSGTSNKGRFSHATPDWVQDRDGSADVTVQLFVKDYSQPGNPYVKTDTAVIPEPCDGITGSTCPSIPTDPTDINLTGDNGKVPGPYVSDMDTYPLKPKDTVVWAKNRNTANFEYVIQKITDQYGQDISVPNPHWSPQTKSGNPFHINWTPFINQYKYDSHALTVTYTTYYQTYKYKATQKVLNPDGTTKGWKMVYTGTQDWDHTSPNDSESHPGNGNWAKAECYNRGFEVHDISGTASLTGDNESPNGASFSFNIPVTFSLPSGDTALRNPNKVCGLQYSASYYIKRADGSNGGGMPGHSSDSGPINPSDPSDCVGGNWADDVSVSLNKSYSATLVPPMQAGDQICMQFSVSPGAGLMNENGSVVSVSQGSLGSDEFCSERVVDKPYMRVYGADVASGSNFEVDHVCNGTGHSEIHAYRSTESGKSGSGGQFAAFAFNQISGFGSASTRTGAPMWATGLTFSNLVGVGGGDATTPNDGGGYQGPAICSQDFYDTKKDNAETVSAGSINIDSLADGKQSFRDGDLTINGGDFNKQATLFVNGNVIITGGHISFPMGGYLAIIAKGNIYIDKSISSLDGVYVAQQKDDGSGGIIYTCTSGGSLYDPNDLYDNCRSQLVINGAFAAKDVKFERAANSLRDSQSRESASGSRAAEIFNFTPEIYLNTPVFDEASNGDPYQYITTLPPVL